MSGKVIGLQATQLTSILMHRLSLCLASLGSRAGPAHMLAFAHRICRQTASGSQSLPLQGLGQLGQPLGMQVLE